MSSETVEASLALLLGGWEGSAQASEWCIRSSQPAEEQRASALALDTPAPDAPASTPAGPLTWQRPSVDTQALDSLNAFAAAGRDFKRSPLGRSVITALELQLDHVRSPFVTICTRPWLVALQGSDSQFACMPVQAARASSLAQQDRPAQAAATPTASPSGSLSSTPVKPDKGACFCTLLGKDGLHALCRASQ